MHVTSQRIPQQSGQMKRPLDTRRIGIDRLDKPKFLQPPQGSAHLVAIDRLPPPCIQQTYRWAMLPRITLHSFEQQPETRIFLDQADTSVAGSLQYGSARYPSRNARRGRCSGTPSSQARNESRHHASSFPAASPSNPCVASSS